MAEATTKQKVAGAEDDQSMEEILQSIRRIIAEEGDDVKDSGASQPAPALKEQPKPTSAAPKTALGSDVLELTDMVNDDGSVVNIKTQPKEELPQEAAISLNNNQVKQVAGEDSAPVDDVLSHIDDALTGSSPKVEAVMEAKAEAAAEESLLSETSAKASVAALKTIMQATQKEQAPRSASPGFRSGGTVEDLALEALRPMLKEWLDANLPSLVERIVEKEIRKITQ